MRIRSMFGLMTILALSAFVAAGCDAPGKSIPKEAICTVNDKTVYKGTPPKDEKISRGYDEVLAQSKKSYEEQGQKFPEKGTEDYKRATERIVDLLIEQEVFQQEAEKLDVKVSEKKVKDRLDQIKQQFFGGDDKEYRKVIKQQGLTETDVLKNIRYQLLTEQIFKEVGKGVKVSDDEAEEYYEENKATYEQKESRQVAHILVKKKADADKIYEQVKGGDEKVFAKIAKAESDDTGSAQNGGLLQEPVKRGDTVPPFEKAAFSLDTDEVSKPVKSQFGFHIIQPRSDITPKGQKTFDEVKAEIKATLEQQDQSEKMKDWREDVLKDAEKDTRCKKGYVWTRTQKTDTSTGGATAPAQGEGAPPAEAPAEGAAPEEEAPAEDAPANE